jgi:N6-L-threonylcarbamoyladenine synthase
MIILGIETSCDETAAAVVEKGRKILAQVVASSVEIHKKFGGIIPEIAAREQLKCLIPVIKTALQESKLKMENIDAIAVTVGPGLIGSLLVGVETAKTLAYAWQKPIIPINHLQAHLYANWLTPETTEPELPAIGLVVSGGHTDLVLMKKHGQIKWLGGTRDDAAGECLDKCARLLDLGYPGGPALAAEAAKWKIENEKWRIKLPRPMINENNFDFSFSGLKTAVLNKVKEQEAKKEKKDKVALAFEIQEAITDVLVKKTLRAVEKYKVKSILLAGGVAANQKLREKIQSESKKLTFKVNFSPPPSYFCTDNAAIVASCAYFNYHPLAWRKIKADSSLEIEEMVKSS